MPKRIAFAFWFCANVSVFQVMESLRLSDSPRHAAVTLVVKRAVVCPARFLRRRVKSDVTDIGSSTQRHAKGLNAAIEILMLYSAYS